jgi:arylsulfatase A-like enzyme
VPGSTSQNGSMPRARFAWPALPLLLLVSGAGLACRRVEPHSPPNIVLIVVDTLRADALGCYGGPADASPRIDALARGGVRFSQARAQAPWTVPSMSSLLTACYPSDHHQAVTFRDLSPRCPNVAVALTANGYTAGAVADVGTPLLRQGFATYEEPFGAFPERARVGRANLARLTFEKAGEWLSRQGRSRFFLLVHTFEVHDYFLSKGYARRAARHRRPGYRGRFLTWALRDPSIDVGRQLVLDLAGADASDMDFVRQLYLEQVRATDAAIGGLLDHLEQLGLREKTLVVLASDHGEGFDREARRFSHGGRLHDDLLHVPLVMSWPGHLAPTVATRPVELVDLVPSLLALADTPSPAVLRGRALVGRRPTWQTRLGREAWGVLPAPERWEGWAEECCFQVGPDGLREARRAPQHAIIAPPDKLIQAAHSVELYDLATDPGETRNRGAVDALARERLAGRLRHRLAAFGESPEGSEAERREMLRSLGYVQ